MVNEKIDEEQRELEKEEMSEAVEAIAEEEAKKVEEKQEENSAPEGAVIKDTSETGSKEKIDEAVKEKTEELPEKTEEKNKRTGEIKKVKPGEKGGFSRDGRSGGFSRDGRSGGFSRDRRGGGRRGKFSGGPRKRWEEEKEKVEWIPKTKLGKLVKEGKIKLDDIFKSAYKIREVEITDFLIPDIEEKLILIGGSPGKGGGIERRTVRRTVRVHKSGRRINLSSLVVVGNKQGCVGFGFGRSLTNKEAIKKATIKARLNLLPVKRGCGSPECKCGREHSIPFTITGKCGSVIVKLMPAPRGFGLCAPDEIKKVFELVGIEDIKMKSTGQTSTRMNFIYAVRDAMRNLNKMKI